MASTIVNGNEHVLKWVIESVESLCDEYSKAPPNDDGKRRMHLELSTVKVLDELEMPTIDRPKHEAQLLTRLVESLARLHDQCEKLLPTSPIVGRLKSLREEMQMLFTPSPICSIKPLRNRQKKPVSRSRSPANKRSSPQLAERTKTPSEEARRPGHEMDRSSRISEMSESALREFRERFSPRIEAKSDSESMDTKAVRTPTEGSRMSDEAVNLVAIDDEPTIGKIELQHPPVPRTMKVARLPAMTEIEEAECHQNPNHPACAGRSSNRRKCLIGIAVVILAPLLFLWLMMFLLDWNRRCLSNKSCDGRSGLLATVWQVICGVSNAFCENYGIFCTDYCASGLQRYKWHSR